MRFKIIEAIADVEVIARGNGVRERARLTRLYGRGLWRKLKGTATLRLENGRVRVAEVHWYEAHGIGRREYKIKHILD